MAPIQIKAAVAGGKIIALIVAGLILLVTVGGWLTNPFGWKEKLAQKWRGKAETAEAQAAIGQGEAAVGRQAVDIIIQGAAADRFTAQIQSENRDAIYSAPGAAAPLDPGVAGAFLDGLCRYDAYKADPGCDRLQPIPERP